MQSRSASGDSDPVLSKHTIWQRACSVLQSGTGSATHGDVGVADDADDGNDFGVQMDPKIPVWKQVLDAAVTIEAEGNALVVHPRMY